MGISSAHSALALCPFTGTRKLRFQAAAKTAASASAAQSQP